MRIPDRSELEELIETVRAEMRDAAMLLKREKKVEACACIDHARRCIAEAFELDGEENRS